jgi:uncharacterized protein
MRLACPAAIFVGLLCVTACWFTACTQSRKESAMATISDHERVIATLRDAYAAFNRGDIDGAVAGLDPQIEWSEPESFPGGGMYHGRDGAKRYLTQSRAAWAEVISEPEQFIDAGDRIVVFVHARVRAKDSNDWQEVRLADVYTMRDGKIVAMRAFADRQEALRWVGR